MASTPAYRIAPSVLVWARTSAGLTEAEAADKASVPEERIRRWEAGEETPTYPQLEKLAYNAYRRPIAVFFRSAPPPEPPLAHDLRNLTNAEAEALGPETRLVLRKAKHVQTVMAEVRPAGDKARIHGFKVARNDDPVKSAVRFREFMGFDLSVQKGFRTGDNITQFRPWVERLDVVVLRHAMPMADARAFALSGDWPVIVLNKNDKENAQLFSLFHEVCHILFNTGGVFRDGDGGYRQAYRAIEDFCNRFASAFLVPPGALEAEIAKGTWSGEWTDKELTKLANVFKVSREVIFRKLIELELVPADQLWPRRKLWIAQATAKKEAQKENRKDDDLGPPKWRLVRAEKGDQFIRSVYDAYSADRITLSDVSNYLDIKIEKLPKLIDEVYK